MSVELLEGRLPGSIVPPMARGVFPLVVAIGVLAVVQIIAGQQHFFVYLSSLVGVNVILAVSLNIVNGMTGQLSIGHAGYMAVGAYIAGKFFLIAATGVSSIVTTSDACFTVSFPPVNLCFFNSRLRASSCPTKTTSM